MPPRSQMTSREGGYKEMKKLSDKDSGTLWEHRRRSGQDASAWCSVTSVFHPTPATHVLVRLMPTIFTHFPCQQVTVAFPAHRCTCCSLQLLTMIISICVSLICTESSLLHMISLILLQLWYERDYPCFPDEENEGLRARITCSDVQLGSDGPRNSVLFWFPGPWP